MHFKKCGKSKRGLLIRDIRSIKQNSILRLSASLSVHCCVYFAYLSYSLPSTYLESTIKLKLFKFYSHTRQAKWRQTQKAKELALAKVEEERRLKEATEAAIKRKQEALRLKIEIDFQRHKDDLQRLEQELSRLKFTTELPPQGGTPRPPRGQTIEGLIQELEELNDSTEKEASYNRECVICMKDEVSVVFLPCAHQVLCASCNEGYMKKGRAICPCCRVPIEQRIRVFGASS